MWDDNQLRVRSIKDVFTESMRGSDTFLGKVEIPANTLIPGHLYKQTIQMYTPKGRETKTSGTLDVLVKLAVPNELEWYKRYKVPTLPLWSYFHPLSKKQAEALERHREQLLMSFLAKQTPPIRREVSGQMLGLRRREFEVRRFKCAVGRAQHVVRSLGFNKAAAWASAVQDWEDPWFTTFVLALWTWMLYHPTYIAPSACAFVSYSVLRGKGKRVQQPVIYAASEDFLMGVRNDDDDADSEDEDFTEDGEGEAHLHDKTLNPIKLLRNKLASLRAHAGDAQGAVESVVEAMERMQGIWSWRDPKVSFLVVCVTAVLAPLLWLTSTRLVIAVITLLAFRHPKFIDPVPPPPQLLFDKLPSKRFLTL